MKSSTLSFSGVSPRSMSSKASRSEEERYFFFFLWNWQFFANRFCQRSKFDHFRLFTCSVSAPSLELNRFGSCLLWPSSSDAERDLFLESWKERWSIIFPRIDRKRPYISLIPPVGEVLVRVHVVTGKVVERLGHLLEKVCHGHRGLPPGAVLEYSGNMKNNDLEDWL